jgi:uncharacterized membrane protein
MNETETSQVFYDAELRPHRSLPPRGFAWMMFGLAGVSFCVSVGFVLRGAWPVTPFFGVDVLLVYWAFRMNYRSARQSENLRLTENELTLDKINVYGERKRWRFQPFWLRITLEEPDEDSNRLLLTSHGRSVVIGSFLGPGERKKVALSLKDALARWRRRVASPQFD